MATLTLTRQFPDGDHAARAMVRRWAATGRPVRPNVLRIANARTRAGE